MLESRRTHRNLDSWRLGETFTFLAVKCFSLRADFTCGGGRTERGNGRKGEKVKSAQYRSISSTKQVAQYQSIICCIVV